ncbi:MAG TPA: MarR family transcriptional regulator [Dehalococcoidia bacterium]|nr:MarR family transcriptional regulator [Dehalococcoidia bacterium]
MTNESSGNTRSSLQLEEDRIRAAAARYGDEFAWADVDAIEISLALLRMHRFLGATTRRHLDSMNVAPDLTEARFNLLITLYFTQDRRLAQNEISRELGVSRTNITNLIDGLERDGLVVRVANPSDRRVSHAQLTEAGEQACRVLVPILTRHMEGLSSDFSEAEKVQFRDYLRRYRQGLRDRYLAGGPPEPEAE